MGKKSDITQAKLIETARVLFLEKGYDGLKMQELADRAEMNKGLLHYYFKSKEALFQAIFKEAIQDLFGEVSKELLSNHSLEVKMHTIIDLYFDKLSANPGLPIFVLSEMNRNASLSGFVNVFQMAPTLLKGAAAMVFSSDIERVKFLNLVISVVSLCVFPFAAQPIVSKLIPGSMKFENFIEQRRDYVKNIASHLVKEL